MKFLSKLDNALAIPYVNRKGNDVRLVFQDCGEDLLICLIWIGIDQDAGMTQGFW